MHHLMMESTGHLWIPYSGPIKRSFDASFYVSLNKIFWRKVQLPMILDAIIHMMSL